jgi:putative FmdB family regulatory protein
MPLYAFHCNECHGAFEVRRSFADADVPADCPDCGSLLTQRQLSVPTQIGNAQMPTLSAPSSGRSHPFDCLCCAPRRRATTS